MARSTRRDSSTTQSALKVVLGALGVGFLLDAVSKVAAEEARRLHEESRRLRHLVLRLYDDVARLLEIQPAPLEFTIFVANAASDGARVLINPEWLG